MKLAETITPTNDAIPAWVNGVLHPVGKLDVHRRALRHKAISVFVFWGEQLLLQRRALGKYHTPGLWANTCCTHPHWRESDVDCAERRLVEELGMAGLTLQSRGKIEYRADVGQGLVEHELVSVFVANAEREPLLAVNPDEVMAVRWITLPALLGEVEERSEAFTPWLRIYLSEYATRIFGTPTH